MNNKKQTLAVERQEQDNFNHFFHGEIKKDEFFKLAHDIKFSENAPKRSVSQSMLKYFENMNNQMRKPIPTFA